MELDRIPEVFQEEGTPDNRAQRKEQAHDVCAGEEQAGQCGRIMEGRMRKKQEARDEPGDQQARSGVL